jgi:hypothetical protein
MFSNSEMFSSMVSLFRAFSNSNCFSQFVRSSISLALPLELPHIFLFLSLLSKADNVFNGIEPALSLKY